MEDIAEPIRIASQETSAMCRVSTTASAFPIRPSTAALRRAASQTTETIVTLPRTVVILEPSATTDNACNRLLPAVTPQLDMGLLRQATPFLFLILFLIPCQHRILFLFLFLRPTRIPIQDLQLLPIT